jgi:O-antigen ligase
VNTLLAIGLWLLLWSGYNTGLLYVESPDFGSNLMFFIHGVRAFFPILAGWIAFLVMLSRMGRAMNWIIGPLGLFLFYALMGLASSVTLSRDTTEATYWALNYLSVILVLVAIVSAENPLPDLSKLVFFNWIVSTVLTFSLLGAVPFLGRFAGGGAYSEMGVRSTYTGAGTILGMTSTRNTGFGRYAAIATLAGLARLRTGKRLHRIIWAGVFLVSLYALFLSNGRTEIAAFIVSALLVLYADKSKRVVYVVGGIAMAILLGMRGFYKAFFDYFTRGAGHVDLTMTGRTVTWHDGLKLINTSPWIGLGFQADRLYLDQHMHNALLLALAQSGFLGGIALTLGVFLISFLIVRDFFIVRPRNKDLIPAEIPGIFLFVVVSSIAEGTFAYFSAAWLLSAPIVVYVLTLHQQIRQSTLAAASARARRILFRRRQLREEPAPEGGALSAPAEGSA